MDANDQARPSVVLVGFQTGHLGCVICVLGKRRLRRSDRDHQADPRR
jgi:hypothetical protein